ncbi:MAG TPA: MFS transporter [Solirubrobacteraceae bacterium]
MTRNQPVDSPAMRSPALLGTAMVLLAFNLRPAAAAVGPLIHRIRVDTGLSGAGASLLVVLPVLCFGAMAPLAPTLGRRVGARATLVGVLVVLIAGLAIRLVPGLGFLFVGTALAGTAIAVANVLLPVLVRQNFHQRTGLMTALYTTALVGGAALAAAVAVPVADAFGGGWRAGLGIWVIPAAVALLPWLLELRRPVEEPHNAGATPAQVRSLLHDRIAWALTLFFGLQSAGFYAALAWLPSIFRSHGASDAKAGVLLGVSLVVGIASSLTVPALATRARDQRALVLVFVLSAVLGWLGILLAPMSAPYLWVVLLGLGQNSLFPLALTMIVLRGGTVANTAALSTLVQSVGYLLAAFAPLWIGALHDATGSWTTPVIVLIVLLVPQTLTGLVAGRRGTVRPSAVADGARA